MQCNICQFCAFLKNSTWLRQGYMTLMAPGVKGPSSREYTAETYLKGHLEHLQLYLTAGSTHIHE